jgi:alkanesulfonate monooxygenase SsuD/methylene tetrahydromethanopterin reductase-like flavin-dependent oxidoreductase (luciferase family)
MIGGGGERKTLRLVAQYADACNVFGGPSAIHHKYEVLRAHCETVGRDPAEIERSTLQTVRLPIQDKAGDTPAQVIDRFGELSDAGAQHVIFNVRDVWDPAAMELLGGEVLPGLRAIPG